MTEPEVTQLAEAIKGYWPAWRHTPQQEEILLVMFGDFPLGEVIDAFRDHKLSDPEDPKDRRPKFRQVQADLAKRFRESIPVNEAWNWGDETELHLQMELFDRRGERRPTEEWILRQHMHREPPPAWKRKQVQEAMRAYLKERGQPTSVYELRQHQQEHINSYIETQRRSAEAAKEKGRCTKRWLDPKATEKAHEDSGMVKIGDAMKELLSVGANT